MSAAATPAVLDARYALEVGVLEPSAGFPLTLESRAKGLAKRSWIKISQIRTLASERIGRRVTRASEEDVARVIDGLNEIVGG
jgi:mRNA interferase MazF